MATAAIDEKRVSLARYWRGPPDSLSPAFSLSVSRGERERETRGEDGVLIFLVAARAYLVRNPTQSSRARAGERAQTKGLYFPGDRYVSLFL